MFMTCYKAEYVLEIYGNKIKTCCVIYNNGCFRDGCKNFVLETIYIWFITRCVINNIMSYKLDICLFYSSDPEAIQKENYA